MLHSASGAWIEIFAERQFIDNIDSREFAEVSVTGWCTARSDSRFLHHVVVIPAQAGIQ